MKLPFFAITLSLSLAYNNAILKNFELVFTTLSWTLLLCPSFKMIFLKLPSIILFEMSSPLILCTNACQSTLKFKCYHVIFSRCCYFMNYNVVIQILNLNSSHLCVLSTLKPFWGSLQLYKNLVLTVRSKSLSSAFSSFMRVRLLNDLQEDTHTISELIQIHTQINNVVNVNVVKSTKYHESGMIGDQIS